jgi:hypothetical protein
MTEVVPAPVVAANAGVPLSATSTINGIPVVTIAAHTSIVQKIQSDLAVANIWVDSLEAEVAAMYPKYAVLVMSVAAFIAGFVVKWIF